DCEDCIRSTRMHVVLGLPHCPLHALLRVRGSVCSSLISRLAYATDLAAGTALRHRHRSVPVVHHAAVVRPRHCCIQNTQSSAGQTEEPWNTCRIRSGAVCICTRCSLRPATSFLTTASLARAEPRRMIRHGAHGPYSR